WVGHFDLTNFLGIPGQFDHPKFLEAIKQVVAAARKHDKGLGFMPTDERWAQEFKGHGFNMLAAGTDQGILLEGYRKILQAVGGKAWQSGSASSATCATPAGSRSSDASRSRSWISPESSGSGSTA